jgi:hypothetical protein
MHEPTGISRYRYIPGIPDVSRYTVRGIRRLLLAAAFFVRLHCFVLREIFYPLPTMVG